MQLTICKQSQATHQCMGTKDPSRLVDHLHTGCTKAMAMHGFCRWRQQDCGLAQSNRQKADLRDQWEGLRIEHQLLLDPCAIDS